MRAEKQQVDMATENAKVQDTFNNFASKYGIKLAADDKKITESKAGNDLDETDKLLDQLTQDFLSSGKPKGLKAQV